MDIMNSSDSDSESLGKSKESRPLPNPPPGPPNLITIFGLLDKSSELNWFHVFGVVGFCFSQCF